jgi:hypothetical protein
MEQCEDYLKQRAKLGMLTIENVSGKSCKWR